MITGWGFGCTLSFGTWTEIAKINFEYIYFYFLQIFKLTNFHFRLILFFCLKMISSLGLSLIEWLKSISFYTFYIQYEWEIK